MSFLIDPKTGRKYLRTTEFICPRCKMDGASSKLNLGAGFCTNMGIVSYFDPSGVRHVHDPNDSRGDWSCSNGHKGDFLIKKSCPASDTGACKHKGRVSLVYIEEDTKEKVEDTKEKVEDTKVYETTETKDAPRDPYAVYIDRERGIPNLFSYTYTVTDLPGARTISSTPVGIPVNMSTAIPTGMQELRNLVTEEGDDSIMVAINVKGKIYTGTLTVNK